MGESVAGGRYRVTWRGGQWVVRAPDGRTAKEFGPSDDDKAAAHIWELRANGMLRAIDQR